MNELIMNQEYIDNALKEMLTNPVPKTLWRKFATVYTDGEGFIKSHDPVFAPNLKIAEIYCYLKASLGQAPISVRLAEKDGTI